MNEPTGYYIETVRVGNHVKVTACDPESGIEASIIGPANASPHDLRQLAIKKLHYVMNKPAQS